MGGRCLSRYIITIGHLSDLVNHATDLARWGREGRDGGGWGRGCASSSSAIAPTQCAVAGVPFRVEVGAKGKEPTRRFYGWCRPSRWSAMIDWSAFFSAAIIAEAAAAARLLDLLPFVGSHGLHAA